jgi:hypothetical protein
VQNLKVKILSRENVLLHDVDISPPDDDLDVVLPETDVWVADWGHLRTGSFEFPLHRSLEMALPYFIEFENSERHEIVLIRFQATEKYLRVGFKIKNHDA